MKDDQLIRTVKIGGDVLINLVEELGNSINSKRLQSRIDTIEELIKVLWKRDLLCDERIIFDILKHFPGNGQRQIIKSFIDSLCDNNSIKNSCNSYAKNRQQKLIKTSAVVPQSSSLQPPETVSNKNSNDEHRRHEIFQILCDNVDAWRDLGRCLDFRDVELSRIGSDHELNNDTKLITYRILEMAESKFQNNFLHKLRSALNEARRKDIIRILRERNLIDE